MGERPSDARAVGAHVLRKEGIPKVQGRAKYVDDLVLPGMLFGATLRSRGPRARITNIVFGEGIPWGEFTVVTAGDLPALAARVGGASPQNVIYLITEDQPCLAAEFTNHPEEPVVLLAHPDRMLLERARAKVAIEEEPLPALLCIEDALAAKHVIAPERNIFKEYLIEKGDLDKAFARADEVVEGVYRTGAQEQLYIEPNGVIAEFDSARGVTVSGSLQCPYYVEKALTRLLGVSSDRVRVIQTETGGGFGGKEEYPSMLSAHAALLAIASGKPVKLVYDRGEDMAATTKRHPSVTKHRTAVQRDGTILGMDIDFVIDGGAYATLSSVVLSRGTIHAAGPYDIPHLRVRGRAVATNTPPHGAFRGFGAPQSLFAMERHLDRIASRLGLSPEEIRRKNFVREGGTLATGQRVRDAVSMPNLLSRALSDTAYEAKRAGFRKENPQSSIKRGMGIACFMHGTGFTGSGEKHLRSVATLVAEAGSVSVRASSTEIGQGTNTIFSQIAADALGLPYDRISVHVPDTANVPNSGPTVASRTCAIVGRLVERAGKDMREILEREGLPKGATPELFFEAADTYAKRTGGPLKVSVEHEQPPFIQWDDVRLKGDAYGSYSWAVYVAEVAVDTRTYEAKVENFYALQDVGTVVHPLLAEGQIMGGVLQGVGFALYEDVRWREGVMQNANMTNYIIPTAVDAPPIRVVFEEHPYPYGAFGAKGIGELPMDGPAPAILNAIEDATGLDLTEIPATPERILEIALSAEEAHTVRRPHIGRGA